MTLTPDTITTMLADGLRPTRGKCFIHLDTPPTMSPAGLLHIPERSQEVQLTDAVWRGTVLAVRETLELGSLVDALEDRFYVGNRVLLLLRAEDIDRTVIITDNTRIVAVIEE